MFEKNDDLKLNDKIDEKKYIIRYIKFVFCRFRNFY